LQNSTSQKLGQWVEFTLNVPSAGTYDLYVRSKDNPDRGRLLSTGVELQLAKGWAAANYPQYPFVVLGRQENETYALPDERDTVVKIQLK